MADVSSYDRDDVKVKGVDSGGIDREIVAVQDGSDYRLGVDAKIEADDGVPTIDYPHYKIHVGKSFTVFGSESIVQAGTVTNYVITTPDTTARIHLVLSVDVQKDTSVSLWENPSGVTKGTAELIYNRDRNSATTATATVHPVTAYTTLGTQLSITRAFGTNQTPGALIADRAEKEFILKQNEEYIVQMLSNEANNIIVWAFNFYED